MVKSGGTDAESVLPPDMPAEDSATEEPAVLNLQVSKSLLKKISQKAEDEGITPQELACELIAEGLVLRAWEIMERKSAMRGGNPSGGYQKGNNRYREQKGRKNFSKGNRAEKHSNILEDRAAFLEYVRNQEKNRR